MLTLCCTFDIEMQNHQNNSIADDLQICFLNILRTMKSFPNLKTTWFVRIDAHVAEQFGACDFAFKKHAGIIDWLLSNGHEVAWHHHAYQLNNTIWGPTNDEAFFLRQIETMSETALKYGLKVVRMGWGQQTQASLKMLSEMGFKADSSAIPSPAYPWNCCSLKDWSNTGQTPYYPSLADYRIAGEPSLPILEIPMSTVPLSLESDTAPNVIRYINPAYKTDIFEKALASWIKDNTEVTNVLTTITHPYETQGEVSGYKGPLSFDITQFTANLELLDKSIGRSLTLSELAKDTLFQSRVGGDFIGKTS